MTKDVFHIINGSINKVFNTILGSNPTIGDPIKKEKELVMEDYTAILGISGNYKGILYFSSSKELLTHMVKALLKTDEINESRLFDMVGEISNMLAGAIQEAFKGDFFISYPTNIQGKQNHIQFRLTHSTNVIPIEWKKFKANLGIGYDKIKEIEPADLKKNLTIEQLMKVLEIQKKENKPFGEILFSLKYIDKDTFDRNFT